MSGSPQASGGDSLRGPLRRTFADPAGRSITLRILLVTCCLSAGLFTTLNLTHGRGALPILAGFAVWAGVLVAVQPRVGRVVGRRRRSKHPADDR